MSSPSPGGPERVALSQDLSEFLIEFSIALHRTSMYPWGHPSLERAASTVVGRLATMLADRPSISIGVARRQLVIEGVATDPKHPVLRSLAEKLHRHHIGAVVFERGVRTDEVVGMMRLIGAEPEKDATPLGLGDQDLLRQWQYVRLYPLTYEQLEMVGGEKPEGEEEAAERGGGTRSAQLWIGLARAALATEDKGVEPESTEPHVVAQAINEHPAAKAYDQVIVGYMLQLAQELKQDGGTGSAAVRRRLSRLIGGLDDQTLQRLVQMGGDLAQRKKFVMDATEALAVDAVVEIVQAAAATTNQSISTSMVRLLTKLSAFAEQGTQLAQVQADTALREQVQLLLQDWTLENPNPDAYTRALESLSKRSYVMTSTAKTHYLPEPIRIVQMALEVESVGIPFWRAVAELIEKEGIAPLIGLLEEAGPGNKTAAALWKHLGKEDRLRELLSRDNLDFVALDRVIQHMPLLQVAPVLMETLVESPNRATRMGVFKRLAQLDIGVLESLIMERLKDERWFVRRNMLALLNEKAVYSQSVLPAQLARHPDARVRREALQLWLRSPTERDRAVCVALTDADERALRIGILEAQKQTPEAAAPLIAKRLTEPLSPELKAQLVRLLAGLRNPVALDAVLRTASTGKTFLGKPKLAPKSPESLAALQVLASTWRQEPRASAILARAQKTDDPDVRAAAATRKTSG